VLRISEPEAATIDIVLPSWIPGSYQIQDQAKFVRSVEARVRGNGTGPKVDRVGKSRWRVTLDSPRPLEFRYEVYAHALLTDGVDLTAEHLWLNAGMCLPYVDGHKDEPYDLLLDIPTDWRVWTDLELISRAPPRYRAASYDELVDSPVDCGLPVEIETRARGATHRLVICGQGGNFEPHRLVDDIRRIAEAAMALFDERTPRPYTFFLHLSDFRDGGLEHRNSNACVFERNSFQPVSSYRKVLSVLSHEYIHRYLVKGIRPRVLGPFDYEHEVHTRLLWLMEGTTDYYAPLLLRRADLVPTKPFLAKWSEQVAEYLQIPGRHARSLEEASFLSWIDLYRPFEDTPNVSVSYYLKGALVSCALDLELRHRTGNQKSLDDVMRHLWARYGVPDQGLGETEFPEIVHAATGEDIREFHRRYIAGTEELDFATVLGYAGLGFKPKERPAEDGEGELPGHLGVRVGTEEGRVRIRSVLEGGPAHRAGLAAGDELVAFNGARLDPVRFDRWMLRYPPGTEVDVAFFSRGVLSHAKLTLGDPPPTGFLTPPVENPTPLQRQIYEGWLADKWSPPGSGPETH
jgi:predicted metalloprotease with PDZ domain